MIPLQTDQLPWPTEGLAALAWVIWLEAWHHVVGYGGARRNLPPDEFLARAGTLMSLALMEEDAPAEKPCNRCAADP